MRGILLLALTGLLLINLGGCSGEKESQEPAVPGAIDPITGIAAPGFTWQQVSGNYVTLFYQPNDSLALKAVKLRNKIEEVYLTGADIIGSESPEPIHFFCYADMATMTEYTSRQAPFYLGDKFYYGYGGNFGRMITLYLLEKLPGEFSQFKFMNEGMPLLFDWTGRNYHQATSLFLDEGNLDLIDLIVDNQSYESLDFYKRQVEAASLLGFLMYEYGSEQVMTVYHSADSFAAAARAAFGKSLTELQREWEAFLPEHTVEKERARSEQEGRG